MSLHVAYDISDIVPGAALQAVGNADRPLSAFTAAAASWCRGNDLLGMWKGLSESLTEHGIETQFTASNVPPERAKLWVRALNGEKLFNPYSVRPDYVPGMPLSEYQRTALASCTVAGGVLALAVGLGKTVTAVNGACHVAVDTTDFSVKNPRCWILAPLNAMGAWKPYIGTLQTYFEDVQIVSVDSAHKLAGVENLGGVLIIDEAHTLGAMTARRTKAAHYLRPLFDVCLCLTGTLLHAGVEKCLSIMDLAVPGAACFSSRWKAGEHFSCLVKKNIGRRTVVELEKPSAKKTEFLEYLARYCVSLDKDSPDVKEAAQIPDQELKIVKVGTPWPKLDVATAALVDEILAAGGDLPHAAEVMHLLSREGLHDKIDAWIDIAHETTTDMPWAWFAHYTDTLDTLESTLAGADETYVRVDGSTPVKDRIEAERKFQAGEVRFFLGQVTAAGIAINLFRTHLSACFDRSWKAIDYAQMLGRTCRRGQTQTCVHYDFVSNRLQEAIVNRLRSAADFNAECAEYQSAKRAIIVKGLPA